MNQLQQCDPTIGNQRKFYGKYRGRVAVNFDPFNMARIRATVADVSNSALTNWALPSLPWCGPGMGMVCIPPIGAAVWIEFEQGDPDYPVWSGCYWETPSEVPASAKSVLPAMGITFQTLGQNVMQLSETGILLKTKLGTVEVRDDQVTIKHGNAEVQLQAVMVKINKDALEIM